MKLARMRFDTVTLYHNPKTLEINHTQTVTSGSLLNGVSFSGAEDNLRIVKGKAELFGEDCFEQFNSLSELCFGKKPSLLSLPGIGTMTAVITKLHLTANPADNVLAVSFEFSEVPNSYAAQKITKPHIHVVNENESLWDVSYIHKIDIERLVELNPWLKSLWDLDTGAEVRII